MENVKDKEICWGIIGAGSVCQLKSAPAMNKIPGSRIAAVMRRTGDKARDFAALHGIPRWYDNADALLSDPEVNAVYIATPPGSHRELTLSAAAAGKPVYVEKPMARTWQECRDMITACEAAGVPLFVAYYRRMLPNYRKIRELVDAGAIGTVRTVHIKMSRPARPDFDRDPANWRVRPELAGGGYFYDLASHQLDFLDYLLGPVTEASGFASNQAGLYPAEDIVTGTFRFANGVHGTGNWCFSAAESDAEDLTVLTGSHGVLSWPTFAGYYLDLKTDAKTDVTSGTTTGSISDTTPGTISGTTPGPTSDTTPNTRPGINTAILPDPASGSSTPANPDSNPGTEGGSIRFHFDMPEHIQQPLIGTIVRELQDFYSGRNDAALYTKAHDPASYSVPESDVIKSESTMEKPDYTVENPESDVINPDSTIATPESDVIRRCPSNGVTAALTNRVMEALTGSKPFTDTK